MNPVGYWLNEEYSKFVIGGRFAQSIKVVVSMFKHGLVTGDRPGEFQFWTERLPLDVSLPFPAGEYIQERIRASHK